MSGGRKDSRRDAAVDAVLTEPTLADAAAKAGVTARTLRRWLKEPDFAGRVREARKELLDSAVKLLERASRSAVAVLVKGLKADDDGDRLKAADRILSWTFKSRETIDFEERLAALEQAAGKQP